MPGSVIQGCFPHGLQFVQRQQAAARQPAWVQQRIGLRQHTRKADRVARRAATQPAAKPDAQPMMRGRGVVQRAWIADHHATLRLEQRQQQPNDKVNLRDGSVRCGRAARTASGMMPRARRARRAPPDNSTARVDAINGGSVTMTVL